MVRLLSVVLLIGATCGLCRAELRLCSLFTDHMVLQRDQPIKVWGWTEPSVAVTVKLSNAQFTVNAEGKSTADGRFDLTLPPQAAGGPFELTVKAKETKTISDVMIGEVWLCSGQSNMQWPVSSSNDADLEALTAKFPNLRMISVPRVGTQELQSDFEGEWTTCTPKTVMDFSAVGYFFGRQLHQTLDVPIGLIDNSWGGSACEAWVERSVLEEDERFSELVSKWKNTESTYDHRAEMEKHQQRLDNWKKTQKGNRPRGPRNVLEGQHRPGNLFAGVLNPVIGYSMKGVIWYQGETNASRGYQYRELFPLMIKHWRDKWGAGDFPFYWVQLADYRAEAEVPGDSDWAELREAQTMTLNALANTGEAVILNLGEASDIHPKNKQDVAKRLARLALANDYGFDLVCRSPLFREATPSGSRMVLKFDHVGAGLDTFDVKQPIGFTIAAVDQKFVAATAKIVGNDTIEVWADEVQQPVAVRYAWADNPVCNVQNKQGLPMTPFRTDEWKGVTADRRK